MEPFEKDAAGLSEPQLTLERSMNELRLRTEAHIGLWGLDKASWAVDFDAGTIEFVSEEKRMRVVAPVQVVGTYNDEDGTWLWGWDHPSVSGPIVEHARLAKAFGERYGLEEYTIRKIECTQDLAWEFAAVACHLAGAEGVYRGPSGPTGVFMTFGTVSITALA
ncbi:hypothetical protein EON79_18945 [bacterium]|nr:MAG: hypothetical protein EON79_18945 [bacterium]